MAEYIKRDTAIRAVMAAKWVDGSDGAMAMEIVASPPAADVVPVVHGRWTTKHYIDGIFEGTNFDECSACGYQRVFDDPALKTRYDYCPRCGAKMDGGAE